MTGDEHAIIEAIRNGDRDQYRVLVDRHREMLYGVLVRLLADPVLADELAHRTFVRAYRGLSGFRAEARFSTWLIQIGVHLARDTVRRRKRRSVTVSLEERMMERGDREEPVYEGRDADPLVTLCARERARALMAALGQLPHAYREVLTLRYFSDWSFEEISAQTGATVGSLKVRAYRARLKLRDALQEQERNAFAAAGDRPFGTDDDSPGR